MTSQFDWSQFQEETPNSPTKSFDWSKFEEEDQGPSRTRSLISAPIKGIVKGAADLAAMRDPVAALLGLNQVTPHQTQAIESILPTQENPIEKGLERAGKLGVAAVGGPEAILAKLARVGVGAGLGQLAEEMGAPELVQNLAELSAFISPTGKFLPKKSQKEAVEFLRAKGFSDKEITPLLQSEKKIRMLSKVADKGKKSEKLISNISDKLGEGYDLLKTQGSEKFLRGSEAVAFDDKLSDVINKIPPRFSRLIEKDVEDLRNRGISQKNLIDFYQDINAVVKGQEGGKAVLGILKKPIMEGLEQIDPKSAKDFVKLNEFYSKKAKLSKGLSKDQLDNFMTKGKIYAAIGSLASGNFALPILKGLGIQKAIGVVARELLINPKLQNLSDQMLKSIKSNDVASALKTYQTFKSLLAKESNKSAEALDEIED